MRTDRVGAAVLLVGLSALPWLARAGAATGRAIVIRGGTILTITQGMIEGGMIRMERGKVAEVGQTVTIPEGAEVIDASGMYVMPGLIAPRSQLGLTGFRGNDLNEATNPVTPEARVLDAIDPFSPFVREVREAGVVALLVTPGDLNVLGGQGAIVRPYGRAVEEMLLREPAYMTFALGEAPKATYGPKNQSPQTRMGVLAVIREHLVKAQEYRRKWEDYEGKLREWQGGNGKEGHEEKKKPSPPSRDLGLEALVKVLSREIPALVHCHRQDDILAALRLGEEFGMRLILDGCAEGYKVAGQIARAGVPVLYGPMRMGDAPMEEKDATIRNPALLTRAGVLVALKANEGALYAAAGNRELLLDAALAVQGGLTEGEALRTVTINPATILGIADRKGSLEVGKDADILLLDGHPFLIRTHVVGILTSHDGRTEVWRTTREEIIKSYMTP